LAKAKTWYPIKFYFRLEDIFFAFFSSSITNIEAANGTPSIGCEAQ